jgi:hypothetical protein
VEEFGPKLELMFAKYGEEKADSEEKKFIHREGCLHDYYVLLQVCVCVFVFVRECGLFIDVHFVLLFFFALVCMFFLLFGDI